MASAIGGGDSSDLEDRAGWEAMLPARSQSDHGNPIAKPGFIVSADNDTKARNHDQDFPTPNAVANPLVRCNARQAFSSEVSLKKINLETPSDNPDPSADSAQSDPDQEHESDKKCEEPEAQQANSRYCAFCSNLLDISAFPDRLPTSSCAHDNEYCTACMQRWVAGLTLDFHRGWERRNCPGCGSLMSWEDLKYLADPATFER